MHSPEAMWQLELSSQVSDMHSPVLMLASGSGPSLLVTVQPSQDSQNGVRCATDWDGLPFLFLFFFFFELTAALL